MTAPRAGLASIACPVDGPATVPFTTTFTYDNAHRPLKQRDPLGHETRIAYDLNGNVISQERDIEPGRVVRTEVDHDQRDDPIVMRQRFDGTTGRVATTRIGYDPNRNRVRVVSPRGSDAGGPTGPYTHYVTEYGYDDANRLTRVERESSCSTLPPVL